MTQAAIACVMGSMDLVRPLALGGVRCAVVAPPGHPARRSRFAAAVIEWTADDDVLVARLLAFAAGCPERPVLYYDSDAHLLFVSRHRDVLGRAFRFRLPPADQVEDLVDKSWFAGLAERLGLPVPATAPIAPSTGGRPPADLPVPFPMVIKPLTRETGGWSARGASGKAVRVDDARGLAALWPWLAGSGERFLAQHLVDGPESRIESYHVYDGATGAGVPAGEFTGRKVRTRPAEFGFTTALTVGLDDEVVALGREVCATLGLPGVAKVDFKRDADGRLWLLEVNPRFNLWHHAGAVAGVNLPALVHRDLTGGVGPAPAMDPRGARWWHPKDLAAAREHGVRLRHALRFARAAESRSTVSAHDPLPTLALLAGRALRRTGSP